jgi:toxin ParE1/3/4
MGRSRSTLGSGVRSVVVGMYAIFYTVQQDRVDVLRVIHGHMDIDEEFKR